MKIDIKNIKLVLFKNNLNNNHLEYTLFLSIILISIYKLNLIGSGFLAFPDEFRYILSRDALKNLSELELKSSIINIFSAHGRPGDIIIKTIPSAFQFLSAKIFGLEYYESKNSFPLFLFNFLIYSCILLIIYKLANLTLKNNFFAFFSVLIYSTLTNSHIYLRHALPYDTSLLIFILVIYKMIINIEKNESNFLSIFYLGLLCFFAYLVYPGYILLYLVCLITLALYRINIITFKTRFLHLIYFFLVSFSCLIIFELLSRFAGTSYIKSALQLSSTITQGSFDESFLFIIKYLIEVEFVTGIILITSLLLVVIIITIMFISDKYSKNSIIILLFFSLTFLYVVYAGYGYYFNKVVLYGRLLHQFFPFLCIFLAFSISSILSNYMMKKSIALILSLVCIYNFFIAFENYLSYSYPRDTTWHFINNYPYTEVTSYCEYENSWSVIPQRTIISKNKLETPSNNNSNFDTLLIVNSCIFYPVNDLSKFKIFNPTPEQNLILSKKHFLNFKAYQYEGYGTNEREMLDKLSMKIKVFSY